MDIVFTSYGYRLFIHLICNGEPIKHEQLTHLTCLLLQVNYTPLDLTSNRLVDL